MKSAKRSSASRKKHRPATTRRTTTSPTSRRSSGLPRGNGTGSNGIRSSDATPLLTVERDGSVWVNGGCLSLFSLNIFGYLQNSPWQLDYAGERLWDCNGDRWKLHRDGSASLVW